MEKPAATPPVDYAVWHESRKRAIQYCNKLGLMPSPREVDAMVRNSNVDSDTEEEVREPLRQASPAAPPVKYPCMAEYVSQLRRNIDAERQRRAQRLQAQRMEHLQRMAVRQRWIVVNNSWPPKQQEKVQTPLRVPVPERYALDDLL